MYMDAMKLMDQKNYIMKNKKITEMEIEEMESEMQASQRSQRTDRKEGKLVLMGSIRDDEYKPNAVTTTKEETGSQQQRDQINKLREKLECMYYQMTQITMDNRPRLQKLQNMFK